MKPSFTRGMPALVLALLIGAAAAAQTPVTPKPGGDGGIPLEAQTHIDAARAAAGTDHVGLFQPLCDGALALAKPAAPRGGGAGRGQGRQGGPPPPPARETWHAEPVKVFDNMYYVGMTEYSAWAITTSQGIILLDAIYDYSIEDEVVGGLKKLGLNPADIKYVVVAHGHLDHAGGAK
ncbi:MAG TPA: MBL fold metallo-hydrolase, partial [Vicinamibacterales bacterium]|nr:MBL fold metallo-hydrolase [Vicinamibacterales bacterium]